MGLDKLAQKFKVFINSFKDPLTNPKLRAKYMIERKPIIVK